MLTGLAFCPQAPALVPALGRGLDAELGAVREACRTAIRRVATPGTRLVVVGGAHAAGEYGPTSRGSFAGWGLDLEVPLGSDDPGPVDLPPSLAVGAWLVRDALGPGTGATGLATASGFELNSHEWHDEAPTALVVMGDGSARRSEKAPGYLDVRSDGFDAEVAAALRLGVASGLHYGEDVEVAELMASGIPAWELVSWKTEGDDWDAELHYEGAPFGVGYHVASWVRAAS